MKINAIKTPIVKAGDDLNKIIADSIPQIPEKSVLVITSKIISYAQNRLVPIKTGTKQEKHSLVKREADQYLSASYSQHDLILTIKDGHLTINAGIDESNSSGSYVLWPENLQQSVNDIWQFARKHYQIKELGVITTDSRTWPLRCGVVGTCLAHCGFEQLVDYRGKKDLFGREIQFVQLNVAESIASAVVLEMGEVAEQTPLGLVGDISKIKFQDRVPTKQELTDLKIELEEDIYGPFLKSVPWVKGNKEQSL
jgi:dihydrofolate synthase / folylpolyglutamate synthase